MKITSDFHKFSPDNYLKEYYTSIGNENKFLLNFYHNCYRNLPPQKRLIEVGGGPAIYQLISASSRVNEIIFSEYLDSNRNAVKKWLNEEPGSFNWDPYFLYISELETNQGSPITLPSIKNRLRSVIKKIDSIDLFTDNPLSIENFDIISVNFCPESITNIEEKFNQALNNIISPAKPGSYLVMAMLKNATSYKVENLFFPAFPVDEKYMKAFLEKEGFSIIKIESIISEDQSEYPGVIALLAKKI